MIILTLRAAHVCLHIICKQSPTSDAARELSRLVALHESMTCHAFEACLANMFMQLDANTYNRVAEKLKKNACTRGQWCTCPNCMVCLSMCDLHM